jgi:26S proteasome regulatory subunit N2
LVFALQKLNDVVDIFWAEISDAIDKMYFSSSKFSEILYEKDNFGQRQLAALVASKVYYHLGEYEEALTFALGAGKLFDISLKNDYVETIVCIFYISKLSSEMYRRVYL